MLEKTKTKYKFIIGEIEENDLFYHQKNLLKFLEQADDIICLHKDTERRIKDYFIKEKKENLITVEKSNLLNKIGVYDYILFTGYLGANDEIIVEDEEKIYYLLNNKLRIKDTLDFIKECNCEKIFSHLVPSELPKTISEETYKFFCTKFHYIPIPISEKIDLVKGQDKKILIIYNEKSKNYRKFKNIYQSINNINLIKLLNENELNFESIISNKYDLNKCTKIVLLDVNPHNKIFVVNFCLTNKLPIFVNDSKDFYDREIIDIDSLGIIKIEKKEDSSIRSLFNRILDNRYSSYKILDKDKYFRKSYHQSSIPECIHNDNFEHNKTTRNIYIQLLELKENSTDKYFFNPLSFQSKKNGSQTLEFVVHLLNEDENCKLSNEVFSRFYNILLNRMLKEKNSWFIYNTILRFIHLRTNIYLDTLTKLYIQDKNCNELDKIISLSVFSLSSINTQESVIDDFLKFLKNFKKFDHLILYIYAFTSIRKDNFSKEFDCETISKTIFNSVVYNLFLNENQKKFLTLNTISVLKNKNNHFYDIFSFLINCALNRTEFDIQNLRSNNTSFSIFEKNPYHYYRLFMTSWLYENHDFSKIMKMNFNKNLCLKNDTCSFIYKSINLIFNQKNQVQSINHDLFYKTNYNIIHILFYMKLNSYNNKLCIDVDKLFDFYKYKYKSKLFNIFDDFYS